MKRIIKIIITALLTLSLCTMMTILASAQSSGHCGDNITWLLDDNGTLTINGTGPMENFSELVNIPWFTKENLCKDVKKLNISNGITEIGESAFSFCAMEEVILPQSIVKISKYAFAGCSNLKTIYIPQTVEKIGFCAFNKLNNLTDIYYGGNENEWKKLTEGTDHDHYGQDYEGFRNAKVHYNINNIIEEKPSSITIMLNNKKLSFDQPPVIIDGRTLVPLRAIFEAMGASVEWNQDTRTAICRKGSTTIKLTIGSNTLNKNNIPIYLDVPAQIVNNRTMVPIRAIVEAFGATVNWNEKTQTVFINYAESKIKALLIAGYDDEDRSAAETFNYSVNQMETALRSLNVSDITKYYMLDDNAYMSSARLGNLLKETFTDNDKDDLSVIYYSGHSFYTDIDSNGNYKGLVTAFSNCTFQEFYNIIKNNTTGTVLLIYDGCFAGNLMELDNYDNRIKIIAACDKDDESTDMVLDYLSDNGDTDNRCSILVYAFKDLIESGKMDINSDGIISFDELHLNLMNLVANICQRYTTSQSFADELVQFYMHQIETIAKKFSKEKAEQYKYHFSDKHRSLGQHVLRYPVNDTTPLFYTN